MSDPEPSSSRPIPSTRRRDRTELYASVLEVIDRYQGRARITRVSYGVGMPLDRMRRTLNRLIDLGFVRERRDEASVFYELTPRGHEFLALFWKMRALTEMIEKG